MAKIPKKVQVIADNLQKVEKPNFRPANTTGQAGTNSIEIHAVEPVLKIKPDILKPKGKAQRKKKKEVIDATKNEIPNKEERFAGYAGLARRAARRIVGEIRGVRFWFDD